jgi:hypothetical protein
MSPNQLYQDLLGYDLGSSIEKPISLSVVSN